MKTLITEEMQVVSEPCFGFNNFTFSFTANINSLAIFTRPNHISIMLIQAGLASITISNCLNTISNLLHVMCRYTRRAIS